MKFLTKIRPDVLRGVREHQAAREHLRQTFARQRAERRTKVTKADVKTEPKKRDGRLEANLLPR